MKYWVSHKMGTCQVNITETGTITWTCPLWRRFIGQPFRNLIDWLSNTGRVDVYEL